MVGGQAELVWARMWEGWWAAARGGDHVGGEAGEGGGGPAGFGRRDGTHEGRVEVVGGDELGLAGQDAVVALLEGFPGVQGLDHHGIGGEGEELSRCEFVRLEEAVDVAACGEEFGKERFVGWGEGGAEGGGGLVGDAVVSR